jgi:hypothetical protein
MALNCFLGGPETMAFYVWPSVKSFSKFILVVGAQTLIVPVLTFAVQGFWLQAGSRANLLDARVDYYRSRERALAHQVDFKQKKNDDRRLRESK